MPVVLRDGFDVSSEVLAQADAVDRQYAQRHEPAYNAMSALLRPGPARARTDVPHRSRLPSRAQGSQKRQASPVAWLGF